MTINTRSSTITTTLHSQTLNKPKRNTLLMAKGKELTKEEEILLQDFSRNVSTKSSALFYGNAFIITAVTAWIFWRIYPIEPLSLLLSLFVLLTAPGSFLIAYAYKNVKFVLKHKFAQKREEAVTKEVMNTLSTLTNTPTTVTTTDDQGNTITVKKSMAVSKKDRDERILWKKNEVSDYEATTYSIFYNNTLFLLCFLVGCCFLFVNARAPLNYALSMVVACGITALFSTGTS